MSFAMKLITIIISIFILHGCAVDPNSLKLKRSANNKLVDSLGAKAEKRRPIENNTYIRKAKLNIANNDNYDEDDDEDEDEDDESNKYDLNKSYRKMYEEMLYKDKKQKSKRIIKGSNNKKIFDQYQNNIITKPLYNNSNNDYNKQQQEKLSLEIQDLKRRLDNLSTKDYTLRNSINKKNQDSSKINNSNNFVDRQVTSKSSQSNLSLEEGGSCLLPDNY
jgi:hypothetical protein